MRPQEDVLSENSAIKQLVHTPIVEFDKYIQCINYLSRAKRELHDLLVYLNESIKLPRLINVLKALIDKIDEKIRMSSRQDIEQSVLFVISHIKAIKFYISYEKGENNADVPMSFKTNQSVLKVLEKDGRVLLKILGNPQIEKIKIPCRNENGIFSTINDNYEKEYEMVNQQKSLINSATFKNLLNQIWVQSIQDGLPSKKILISYAWPLQDDKYKNDKGETVELKELWVQEFLQNLVNFLVQSGIVVYFDKNNSGGGFILSKFMQNKIQKADHCLIISTRTLGYKMRLGKSGVCFEYDHMKLRMDEERHLLSNRFIIPVLLNNNFYGPREFAEIGEIIFCYKGFLYGYESLLKSLYRYGNSIDFIFLKYRNYLEQMPHIKSNQPGLVIKEDHFNRAQNEIHLFNFLPRNMNFMGREMELTRLKEHIHAQRSHESSDLALSVVVASGGKGKSFLVNEFAYQYRNQYELVCLIPAETVQQIESCYAELASDLEINCDKEVLIKELRKWWRSHSRCLIIFDNAKSYNQILNYLPLERCDVVITSQSLDWPAGTMIKLETFSLEDAKNYVEKVLEKRPIDTPEKVKRLLMNMECFPLRLAHACATIKKMNIDIDAYLALEKSNSSELYANTLLPPGDHHTSIYITYLTAMNTIEQVNPLSAIILKCCAYLYSDQIPSYLFYELHKDRDNKVTQNEIHNALELLTKYSLIDMVSVYDQLKVFKIHRVVQEVIRFNLIKINQHEYFIRLTHFLLHQIMPYGYHQNSRDNVLQKKILTAHFETYLLIIEDLSEIKNSQQDELTFNVMIRDKGEESLYEIDSNLMQSFYNERVKKDPLPLPNIKHVHQHSVQLHWKNRARHTAGKYHHSARRENASQQASSSRSDTHIKITQALKTHSAVIQHNQDKNSKVGFQHLQQLDLPTLQLCVLSYLNDIYYATVNVARHKVILQRILYIKKLRCAKLKTIYELDEVRKTFSNLAGVFEKCGDAKRERFLHEKALIIAETLYDDNHPEMAIMLLNFSCALFRLHEFDAQAQCLMRAKKIIEKHAALGQNHPEIASIIMSLGLNFLRKGKKDEAQHLIKKAQDIHSSQSTEVTADYISMICNLAVMHGNLGLCQQEHDLLVQALEHHLQYYRDINVNTARIYVSVANAKCKINRANEAIILFKDANEIFIKAGLIDNDERASLLVNLANAYGILKQYNEQESLHNTALQIYHKNKINMNSIDVAHIYMNLVDMEMRRSPPNLGFIKEKCCLALDILLTQQYQINKIIAFMKRLGSIFIKLCEANLAQKCYVKILDFLPDNKFAHENLACMYHVTGKIELAEQHFKLAIQYGSSFSVLCDYSLLLMRQKRYDDVVDYLISCTQNEPDKSYLIYSQLELTLHDNYLQQEINNCIIKNGVYEVQGVYLAHYLLFRALQFQGNREYENVLNSFQILVDKYPSPQALRLISFIYKDLKRAELEQKCLSKANELIKNQQNLEASKTNQSQLQLKQTDKEPEFNVQHQRKPGM